MVDVSIEKINNKIIDNELYVLTNKQQKFYEENGYLVLQNFIPNTDCSLLETRIKEIINNRITKDEIKSVFVTGEKQEHINKDDYFLSSGDKIRIFLEDTPELKVNKVGHALHLLDPVFFEFTHNNMFRMIAYDLSIKNPLIVQSMYIFKSPGIGSKVLPHQDSTFLYTETGTCHAFWIPLEDTTIKNGCLWVIPGSHKGKLIYRKKVNKKTNSVYFEPPLNNNYINDIWKDFVPLEVTKGSLVLLHGLIVHKSEENKSKLPRDAYTFHIIDGNDKWSEDNWLQYNPDKSFDKL